MFTKRETKEAVAAVKKGYDAHAIGLTGTVEEFHTEVAKAQMDLEIIKKAYSRIFKVTLDFPSPKYKRLHEALRLARDIPFEMRRDFMRGSVEAFLAGRPDNIQAIVANPSDFLQPFQAEENLAHTTIIKLMNKSTAPETVPDIAFATIPSQKQEYLDKALIRVISYRKDEDITATVSALLKAGANPGYNSSESLAYALHKEIPAKYVDILLNNKKSANLEDALQRMRDHRDTYGNTPEKIEERQRKDDTDAKLRQMQETINELTRRLEAQGIVSPAPAEQAEPPQKYPKLNISGKKSAAKPQ